MYLRRGIFGHLVMIITLSNALAAQGLGDVSIHGYGNWAVASSDPYAYRLGIGEGDFEFDNVSFSLAVAAEPLEKLQVFVQFFGEKVGQEEDVQLELAIAQWNLSVNHQLRFGRIKLPFGIYAETFEVGTLRPFFFLPVSIYGPTGVATEAFDGLGLSGRSGDSDGWGLSFDIYAGDLELDTTLLPLEVSGAFAEEDPEFEEIEVGEFGVEEEALSEALGGRLVVSTPIEGLSFGVSAYSGKLTERLGVEEFDAPEFDEDGETLEPEELIEPAAPKWGDHRVISGQVEYLKGPWSVRSEYALHDDKQTLKTTSGYVELARMFGDKWQLAGRFDTIDVEAREGEVPSFASSVRQHEDLGFSLNYWSATNFVLKLGYHHVEGNLIAHPSDLFEAIDEGRLDRTTDLVTFGAQFSF